MRKLLYLAGISLGIYSISCSGNISDKPADTREMVAENDSVQVLMEIVDSAKDKLLDVPVTALWIRNKSNGSEKKLLQTVRPDWHCWYMGDGEKGIEVPIDSITAISNVHIIKNKPLKLLVEGVPDCRNVFSHIIDVDKRKALYIPANRGYLGMTPEEGYLIFSSYRYFSDPEEAGRYTFLQLFNDKGVMVDSLDLEHAALTYGW